MSADILFDNLAENVLEPEAKEAVLDLYFAVRQFVSVYEVSLFRMISVKQEWRRETVGGWAYVYFSFSQRLNYLSRDSFNFRFFNV